MSSTPKPPSGTFDTLKVPTQAISQKPLRSTYGFTKGDIGPGNPGGTTRPGEPRGMVMPRQVPYVNKLGPKGR
jgi:hypothetical protein